MPNPVAAGLAALLYNSPAQPCHTPRGNNTSMCAALKFIPATVNTELSALAQTYGVCQAQSIPGTTICPHGTLFFPSALGWKQAVQEGKTSSLQSLSIHAWTAHSQGNSMRGRWSQSQCWSGYTEHVTGGLNTCWSTGSTHRVLPSSEVQTTALIKHRKWKDLYPLQFAFLNWVQGHSLLIGFSHYLCISLMTTL